MVQVNEINWLEERKDRWMIGVNAINGTIGIQWWTFNDCIIMQYTWLKDKNWKEIYEGDIVCEKETVMSDREEIIQNYINIRKDDNFKYSDWTIGKRRYWQKIYIVERDESSCWFEPFADSKNNCWHCWWWINWNSIEIIGNIYENPELLSP